MSTETHVFFRGKLPTKAALSRAMKELGFPFAIKPATGSLEQQSGFMPMTLRREGTGVEFDVFNDHSAVREFAKQGVDQSYERVANFRWSGDFQEAVAGMCGAAALAKLVNGVVFDEAEDKLLSVEEAIALARRHVQALVKPEVARQPGTRPADIKRYLKPLLKQRSDLVLTGRCLMIRPVRHLRRGVFFDRTSNKYRFRVWRYIDPLFSGTGGTGYGDYIFSSVCEVWEPHFEPMLLDRLAEDVFDYVGRMTTLGAFADALEGTHRFFTTRVIAFVLAGQRERAIDYVNEIEARHPDNLQGWVKAQRTFMERDIGDICAEYRAKETATANELGLGDIWQPAPFAAEVPETERAAQIAEPTFSASPWISRPPWLLEEPPRRPGEIRFAREALWRKGRVIMAAPLTRAQAEERHRNHYDYMLFARLEDEIVLNLERRTGQNPDDPERSTNPAYIPRVQFNLILNGSVCFARAWFGEDLDDGRFLHLHSINVGKQTTRSSVWYCSLTPENLQKTTSDHRREKETRAQVELTSDERGWIVAPIPGFSEFDDLLWRVRSLLRSGGYGDIANLNAPAEHDEG
jgi:hypothetical protein